MRIIYQIPSLDTVYAIRFIYEGYKNAFEDLGHQFVSYTANDNLRSLIDTFKPHLFITSLNGYNLKYLDLPLLKKYRNEGLVLFTQIGTWKEQCTQYGARGLSERPSDIKLITNGLAGDIFFHWLERDDPFMDGFTKTTGYPFYTILLAADKHRFFYEYDSRFAADISYIGSRLPEKKAFFKNHLTPLQKKYNVKIYGSDWTIGSQMLGYVQKIGQYFNIPKVRSIRKLMLGLDDERKVYASSKISLNIHEEHQRKYGSDFNERTLKIIASGGFEICDNVKILRKFFSEDELVIAANREDWFNKIEYYLSAPEQREKIIKAGQKKVLSEHTYHNRVAEIIGIYSNFIN